MTAVFTTSYLTDAACNIISAFVGVMQPKLTVEIGAQQGHSAILICRALPVQARFATFDLFEEKYSQPPFSETHANFDMVVQNIRRTQPICEWTVHKGTHIDAVKEYGSQIDLLHLDICNHYDNVWPILRDMSDVVQVGMILEGGVLNHWQEKHNYKPWHPILKEEWFIQRWSSIVIPLSNQGNAVTLCARQHG